MFNAVRILLDTTCCQWAPHRVNRRKVFKTKVFHFLPDQRMSKIPTAIRGMQTVHLCAVQALSVCFVRHGTQGASACGRFDEPWQCGAYRHRWINGKRKSKCFRGRRAIDNITNVGEGKRSMQPWLQTLMVICNLGSKARERSERKPKTFASKQLKKDKSDEKMKKLTREGQPSCKRVHHCYAKPPLAQQQTQESGIR